MTTSLAPLPRQAFGPTFAGYKLFTYAAGTLTKLNSFTDSTGTTPNTNPIILDANGSAAVWFTPGLLYKEALALPTDTDPPTVPIWTADNLPGADASAATYTPPGTGGVVTTIAGKLQEITSVTNYGTKGNGIADDTAAFNAAQVYANSINAAVFIPAAPISYVIAGTITALTAMVGVGFSSILSAGSATLDVIQVTQAGVTLSNFWMNSTVARTAGYYINSIGVNYTRINAVSMFNWFNGIGYTGAGATTFRVFDCNMSTNVPGGIGVTITTSTNGADLVLQNVLILGPTTGTQCAAGVQITNAGDITLDHVLTVKTGIGLNIQPAAGQIIQYLVCTNSQFDSGSGTGVQFNMLSTGSVQLAKFTNVWACTNANGFVLGTSLAGTLLDSSFTNCIGSNNVGGVGFQIAWTGCTNTLVMGGSFSLNAYGMYVSAGVTLFKFLGARSGPSGQFGANTIQGLVLAGTNDKFSIKDCDFTGNANAFSIVAPVGGTPGQTWFIEDNQGIVTASGGQATLTAGATTTTVTHGLAGTPRLQDIVLTPNSGAGSGVFFAVTSVTSSNFVITAQANPGAGVLMGWNARLWGA
jgi:hypothetical protein